MAASKNPIARLFTVGLVLAIIAGAISILMPSLQRAKHLARQAVMESKRRSAELPYALETDQMAPPVAEERTSSRPKATVKECIAKINLTPRLSIGTETPESLYIADFEAEIKAKNSQSGKEECELELPLPPQIISLADLEIQVNGEPSESFDLKSDRLVWHGFLDDSEPANIRVKYSAVGKGVYTLGKPSGKIIDVFHITLIANKSNIRMLELSLQPNSLKEESGRTVYEWDYKRLVVGRPIAIDVLGIAAIDRLGELVWLAPVSVLVFGVLIALVALAYHPDKLTVWMLVLIVGCFALSYPLMYFMQEYLDVAWAMILASLVVLIIIAVRSVSLFGPRVGIPGGLLLPASILILTLLAAVYTRPAVQGMLLTAEGILTLVVAMCLLPRAQRNMREEQAAMQLPPVPATKETT